ncbi:hypothetical protein EON79_10260 [bacterium]|nr:MAG: hypothetical protein EON79_10260 [bacterium]
MRGTIILAQNRSDYGCTVKELGWDKDINKPSLLPINRYFEEPTDPEGWDAVAKLIGLEFVYEGIEMTAYEPSGIRPEQLAWRGFRTSTQKLLDSMPRG